MADAFEVAELWAGGVLPPQNDYTAVQLNFVPYQEQLISLGAFDAFRHQFAPHLIGMERWLLKGIIVGQLSRFLHELNPLPVKLDRNAGYEAVYDVNTNLWDLQWQPSYGQFLRVAPSHVSTKVRLSIPELKVGWL